MCIDTDRQPTVHTAGKNKQQRRKEVLEYYQSLVYDKITDSYKVSST